MITKEEFLTEFNGHGNAYSSYMVIGVKLDDLLRVLNEINPEFCVGSGRIEKNYISFEICKELPDRIYDFTEKLHCTGYADIGAWYGEAYFETAKDGRPHDDYTADWADDNPLRRDWDFEKDTPDEEMEWDGFVDLTDNETGIIFHTGDGAISYDQLQKWQRVINEH